MQAFIEITREGCAPQKTSKSSIFHFIELLLIQKQIFVASTFGVIRFHAFRMIRDKLTFRKIENLFFYGESDIHGIYEMRLSIDFSFLLFSFFKRNKLFNLYDANSINYK